MKKFFLLAAAAIALAACNNDDNYIDQPLSAQITATIGQSVETRTSGESWNKGDKIGITSGKYANMEYTTDNGEGDFTGKVIYFKNKREPEDFTAYYPYTGSEGTMPAPIEATTEVSKQTPEAQAQFDFLYAEKRGVIGADNTEVAFDFFHKMSKITLIFKDGIGNPVSTITSYRIEGLKLKGTFDPATDICAASDTAAAESLEWTVTAGNLKSGDSLPSFIVFPQNPDQVTLRITADIEDGRYVCNLGFDGGLESGKHYLYTITVHKTKLLVGKSEIVGWDNRNDGFDAVIE